MHINNNQCVNRNFGQIAKFLAHQIDCALKLLLKSLMIFLNTWVPLIVEGCLYVFSPVYL